MKALCFGSINFDYIYKVDHFVEAGETISCNGLETATGGKGLNQSVALAKAGVEAYIAGAVGEDGLSLIDILKQYGVNTNYVSISNNVKTGHAIIQNNKEGNNCILTFSGANKSINKKMIENTLKDFSEKDFLIIQNEINCVNEIVNAAKEKGMLIALNPSPFKDNLLDLKSEQLDYLILNEIEAYQMMGQNLNFPKNTDIKLAKEIMQKLKSKYSKTKIVLTLGENGSIYSYKNKYFVQEAFNVKAIDTTAAGDTFMGYFIASIMQNLNTQDSMKRASKAASITVTKLGAAQSIPSI